MRLAAKNTKDLRTTRTYLKGLVRLDIYDIVYAFLPLYTEIITYYF